MPHIEVHSLKAEVHGRALLTHFQGGGTKETAPLNTYKWMTVEKLEKEVIFYLWLMDGIPKDLKHYCDMYKCIKDHITCLEKQIPYVKMENLLK